MEHRARMAAREYRGEAVLALFISGFFAAVGVLTFMSNNPNVGLVCTAIAAFFGFVANLERRSAKRILREKK